MGVFTKIKSSLPNKNCNKLDLVVSLIQTNDFQIEIKPGILPTIMPLRGFSYTLSFKSSLLYFPKKEFRAL